MNKAPRGSFSTIRIRLATALAAALLPVLVLGGVQSTLALRREAEARRESLAAAAERSASTARARMEAADILLQTLAPGSVGAQCVQRLAQVVDRIPGYSNLIRFDSIGRVACAAGDVPQDPERGRRPWFEALEKGDRLVITRDPGANYSTEPALLAAVRASAADSSFDGALVAVISLRSLAPSLADRALPARAEVALAGSDGRYINFTNPSAFVDPPTGWRKQVDDRGSMVWYAVDRNGERRVFSAAPLVDQDLYVVLSARSDGLFSWAQLNPLTGLVYPILTFALALVAVMLATERVVIRWIAYLQRIAALYGKGRLSVRAIHADRAPPEIRDLAATLEDMADAIVVRDGSLRENLAQKDALMREIHHRVKNNLQVISSLLNIQQRALADPTARAAMSDTRQRISALALIYRALYQGQDIKRVDLRAFLEELTGQLIASEGPRGAAVQTEILADTLIIEPDRLAPLALFAVEAITNSQKHAFAGRGGQLRVELAVGLEQAVLEISDDGSPSDTALTAGGVGRTLMAAFARQLRGRTEVIRNGQGGMTARLVFPVLAGGQVEKVDRVAA
jgi:two-component sensor histidine kinase